MLHREQILCFCVAFSVHLFCGTRYAHFPFTHSVQHSFLFLFFSCSMHWLSYSQNSFRVSGMKKSYCIRKKNQNNITGYLESKIQTIMSTSATLSFSCPPNTFLFCSIIFFSFSSISSYQQHPWKHGGVSNQINYFFPSLLFCMATQESNS